MEMKEKRKEKNEKRGVGCKKGGCCVLSTSTCDNSSMYTSAIAKEITVRDIDRSCKNLHGND